ncbi:MAG: DUF1641 domain-containing protein [Pirellula sp.]|nr:DUF1641 domain-containing protein [Pirellula sp.]
MARPIAWTLPARDPNAELQGRVQDAPAEHAEALLAAYEVLQGLHDRGVLELLRGALGSSDKVLEIAVDAAKSPESIRGIRNLMLLAKIVGEIDPVQLGNVTRAVPTALNAVNAAKPPSLWRLLTALWNKNVRRGLWLSITLLEAIGQNMGNAAAAVEPSHTSPDAPARGH